ncbi:MAP3K3, partial [Symbiodinium pilosum]
DRTREELKKIGLPSGADFSTDVNGKRNWAWVPVANDNKEDELMNLLQKYAIDVAEFSWQSFSELYDEVYTNRLSELQEIDNELLRTVRIVKVWLSADILGCRHVLVMKTKQQRRKTVEVPGVRALSMRMRAAQTWDDAAREALHDIARQIVLRMLPTKRPRDLSARRCECDVKVRSISGETMLVLDSKTSPEEVQNKKRISNMA